jgi:hypothetical protein
VYQISHRATMAVQKRRDDRFVWSHNEERTLKVDFSMVRQLLEPSRNNQSALLL